jgi:hypothetical protein
MPIQNTDYWVDDTLDDSNFTSERKPKKLYTKTVLPEIPEDFYLFICYQSIC